MKNLSKKLIVTAAVLGIACVSLPGQTQANPAPVQPTVSVTRCAHWGNTPSNMTVNSSNIATATFTVPAHCTTPQVYTLVSYTAPNGTTGLPYTAQKLYKSVTKTFGPGTHTMQVQVPDCFYQVDLVGGYPVATFPNNQALYHNEHRFFRALHGGTKSCETPKPPVTPPAQPPAKTPEPPVATPVTPAAAPAEPAELPNTGPGAIVAIFTGVSAISTLLYSAIRSRTSGM